MEVEDGWWKMDGGRWMVEDGWWKMDGGRWEVEGGRCSKRRRRVGSDGSWVAM
jgi:hypothetical protein